MFRVNLVSKRNKPLISNNNYIYSIKRKYSNSIEWRCVDRPCPATVKTPIEYTDPEAMQHFIERGEHTHSIKINAEKVVVNRNNIKSAAVQLDLRPKQLIGSILSGQSLNVVSNTGSDNSLKLIVHRARRKVISNIEIVEHELQVERALLFTRGGDKFYQFGQMDHEGYTSNNGITIFYNPSMIQALLLNNTWAIDGTFKVCPDRWNQFYTISAIIDNHVVPIIFCLLPSKTQAIYEQMIDIIKHRFPSLNPSMIISDFEKAAINAFKRKFAGVRTFNCMFHLSQSIQRKLQECGLQMEYANNLNIQKYVKLLKCLAFINVIYIESTFRFLINQDDFPRILTPVYAYFYRTYVGSESAPAMFPMEDWNCVINVMHDSPKTNNAIEAWHRVFKDSYGTLNNTPRNFVKKLIEEEENIRQKFGRLLVGEKLKHNKIYADVAENIKKYIKKCEDNNLLPIQYIFFLAEFIYY